MEPNELPPLPPALQRIIELSDALHDAVHQFRAAQAAKPAPPQVATAPEPAPLKLSGRMLRMLQLMRQGYTYKEIADQMHCHLSTLRTYRERICKRYGIKGKGQLIGWATLHGLGSAHN